MLTNRTFDAGCGSPAVIDMGAFEYQFDPVEDINYADITGDFDVNTENLLALLAACGDVNSNCLADLNADGAVNTFDLLELLAN